MSAVQPGYLDVDGHPVSVVLHWPEGGSGRGVGVLMCPAWGREESCSHGPWRAWAQALAQAGYPTLRLDYPGEGDAWGRAEEASRLALWERAVQVAVARLVARTGVSEVCLMGLRWGSAVAWRAALQTPQVSTLLAVAPVVRGRTFVRELSALQAASSGADEAFERRGGFQSGGFVLGAGEIERWSALDLLTEAQGDLGSLQRVIVLDRDDLPAADKWVAQLQARGLTVHSERVPGYADMMADPHHASLPAAWVQASLACLERAFSAGGRISPVGPSSELSAPWLDQARLRWAPWRAGGGVDGGGTCGEPVSLTEHFVHWPDTPATGVLTTPGDDACVSSGHAILLLNAGSTQHIGPSRMWVELARDWASQGHTVLRLDLAGLGDSEPRPGCPPNQTYPHAAVDDVRSVVAWLQRQPGVRDITAGGLCAGGYHALAAVRAGVPLRSILMINPLIFLGAEGLDLGPQTQVAAHQAQSAMSSYKQALFNPSKWRKLLGGQVNLGVLKQVLQRRLQALAHRAVREVTRAVGMPLRGDLARVFRDAMDARVAVHLFFAAADPGLALLEEELGSARSRLARQSAWHCTVLPSGDHVFTRWSDRMALMEAVQSTVPEPIVR